MPTSNHYRPAPRLPLLGDGFYDVVEPARFPLHRLRFRNQRSADRVGLGELDDTEWERAFARFEPLRGNLAEPLALRYHGVQFGVYNPNLGDGRAFVHAELRDAVDGRLLDLGTKGSGRTPWSRDGDGRLTLIGGVREVLAAEMLEALGVPTSKAMSLYETGENLHRNDEPSPTRSSVLVRLGHSHLRVGTFQRFAYHDDAARIRRLLEFCLAEYLPGMAADGADPAAAFFAEVVRRSADLCAAWIAAGFVHGVLNSDNQNVTGESFDYGPWRFLPTYDPGFVAAYFDHSGLYAFGRQPAAVKVNMAYLAEALMPVTTADELRPAYERFEELFHEALGRRVSLRLGLVPAGADADAALADAVFAFLAEAPVPFEAFFFDWFGGAESDRWALDGPRKDFYRGERFAGFRALLAGRTPRRQRPDFGEDAPPTLLDPEVKAIAAAINGADDWRPFEEKVAAIRTLGDAYALAPSDGSVGSANSSR